MGNAHSSELAGAALSSTEQRKIARRSVGRASRYKYNVNLNNRIILDRVEIILK
jgi:hypothetical protein